MSEKVWDYTSVDTFLRCKRKYYWRMVRHLTIKTVAPALSFGLATHEALEEYYKTGSMEKGVALFVKNYQEEEGEQIRTIINGVKMLEGYAQVYPVEPFKIIGLEVGFVVPIQGDITILWGGRLDGLVDWGGALYVLEHKTTSRLGASFFKQFNPHMQPTSYTFGASEYLGKRCHGVIINALEPWKEVMRKTVKTKKLEDHFARDPVSRSAKQIDDFKIEIVSTIGEILEREKKCADGCDIRKCFPPTQSECFSYNYACPFKDLCLYGEDERLMGKFKTSKWEPYAQKEEGNV